MITQCRSVKRSPNAMRAISMESSARSGVVTEPMKGLSPKRRCAYTMSRWRLFTGWSTGSHTVPPEWCSHGDAQVSLTRFSKSASVP